MPGELSLSDPAPVVYALAARSPRALGTPHETGRTRDGCAQLLAGGCADQ